MRKLLKLKEVFKSTLKGLELFISQFLKAADVFQSLFVYSPFERKEGKEKKNFFQEKIFFRLVVSDISALDLNRSQIIEIR